MTLRGRGLTGCLSITPLGVAKGGNYVRRGPARIRHRAVRAPSDRPVRPREEAIVEHLGFGEERRPRYHLPVVVRLLAPRYEA